MTTTTSIAHKHLERIATDVASLLSWVRHAHTTRVRTIEALELLLGALEDKFYEDARLDVGRAYDESRSEGTEARFRTTDLERDASHRIEYRLARIEGQIEAAVEMLRYPADY